MITMEELERRIRTSKGMTAADSEALFNSCPEWVEMRARQDAEREALEARYKAEEELLVADLRRAGYPVRESVYELVNTAESYPQAIPVLLNHLRRPYSNAIKEGIVRALTVREARGIAGPGILEALREPHNNSFCRWAMANALTIVADRKLRADIEALIEIEADENVRTRLKRALKTALKP